MMNLHTSAYLSLIGPAGLREVNNIGCANAHRLVDALAATGRLTQVYPDRPFLNEVLLQVADGFSARQVIEAGAAEGILAGVEISADRLLVACTEMQTSADIERYVQFVKALPCHE